MAVRDAAVATTVPGIEQIVIVRVERTSAAAAQVVAVVRRLCSGGGFGAEVAVDPGGWPVGLDSGVDGSDGVEGLVPLAALGNPQGLARVVFSATKTGGNSDVLLTTTGTASGAPLRFAFRSAAPAPVLGPWAMAAAVLLLGLVAYAGLRRHPLVARLGMTALVLVTGGLVVAQVATITADGAVGDWTGIGALGRDVVGDSSAADDAEDIVAAFMARDDGHAYFRIDLLNVIDASPTDIPTATPTHTPVSTPTQTVGNTPTQTPTATPTATATPTNTPTATPTHSPTNTPTQNAGNTPTQTPTATSSGTATATPTDTLTATPTHTPTSTPTQTATHTPTDTPTATATQSPTGTPTTTPTNAPIETPTDTPTVTPSQSPTATPDCGSGYHFDGSACVDIDECAVCPGVYGAYPACPCGKFGVCTNTPGSYSCAFSAPNVTSVSPFIVTVDSSSALTIVGVGLGLDQDDLASITVGTLECLSPTHVGGADSETMVNCTMAVGVPADADDKASVIVTTKSGGAGACVPSPPNGCADILECFPAERDCMLVCHGTSKPDDCGVCNGDNSC